eukprot:gene30071-35040_t
MTLKAAADVSSPSSLREMLNDGNDTDTCNPGPKFGRGPRTRPPGGQCPGPCPGAVSNLVRCDNDP